MRLQNAFSVLILASVLAVAAGCSRENQDWRSAQAADTIEAYDDFVAKHAQSEFAEQAKARVKQLAEERDWERATVADTADAYQQFLTQHPEGKWAQEARIRIENFNVLDGATPAEGAPAAPEAAAAAAATPAPATAPKVAESKPAAPKPEAPKPEAPKPAAAAKAPAPKAAPAPKPAAAAKAPAAPKAAAPAVAAKAPAVSSKAAAATTGSHRVQLGAFSSEAKADAEWKRVSAGHAELKGLSPQIVPAQTSAGRLYRLQVGVTSEQRGRAICKSLTAQGQACVYVSGR